MFIWLENTAIAYWVGGSLYGYPFLLGMHAVGLAVVVGIFIMRDLRLLGLFKGIRPDAFLPISKLAWIGFIINAISGVLLFTSQASVFVSNIPFLLKITSVIAGMVTAGIIQSRLRTELAGVDAQVMISRPTRVIAAVSLGFWLFAIITGRLIAYL